MSILVIAEHDNRSLKNSTLNAVSAALLCGQDVHLLVAGYQCRNAADEAAKISGVSKVLMADAVSLADTEEKLGILFSARGGCHAQFLR